MSTKVQRSPTPSRLLNFLLLCALASASTLAAAVNLKHLPYPVSTPSAEQIIQQVYFVNHFYAFDNFSIIRKSKKEITVLLTKAEGKRPKTITVERHLNNEYTDNIVQSKDLAIFRSGNLRGTGILITDYVDDNRSQSYSIWLPSLRKVRRFSEPAHEDAWGGTDFTFGDVALRKPKDETHELIRTESFDGCLGIMDMEGYSVRYLKTVPETSCEPKGKQVYVIRSTPKREKWWYDYRESYVDTKTFADYRTRYFKNNKEIKIIDRDWRSSDQEDPRALVWAYWYGKIHATKHETWAIIPKEVVRTNQEVNPQLWKERTLRRIKR